VGRISNPAGLDDPMVLAQCKQQAAFYASAFPDTPPFASPVHWAAFEAIGLAYPLPASSGRASHVYQGGRD
jgi:hypothetical protein